MQSVVCLDQGGSAVITHFITAYLDSGPPDVQMYLTGIKFAPGR